MKYTELIKLLEATASQPKPIESSKTLKLASMKVEVKMWSEEEHHYIEIKSLKDPNIKGKIFYDTLSDLKLIYKELSDTVSFLNYLFFNSKNNPHAYKLSQIVSREISKLKQTLTPEEYQDLDLEFDIKTDIEREIEAQAQADAALAQAQPEEEPAPEAPAPPAPEDEVEENSILYDKHGEHK